MQPELRQYLETMICPPEGQILYSTDIGEIPFDELDDCSYHGAILVGEPTPEQAEDLLRILTPGAHVMLMGTEESPTAFEGVCRMEDGGFEVRDAIFFADDPERFKYASKASRKEREAGCGHLPARKGHEAVERKEGSAGVNNPRAGAGRTADEVRNFHPCLHPEALVMTPDGYREISSLGAGGLVYSADGSFHEIEVVSHHPYTSPNLYEIDVLGTNLTVLASDNHPFLIWRPKRKHRSIVGGEVLWVEASEIRKGDYTMTPVLSDSPHPDVSEPLPEICSTPGFWFLFGLYLAEGSELSGSNGHSYPSFSLHGDESELISRIEQFAAERGKTSSTYPKPESKGVQVVLFDEDCWKAFHMLGGKLAHQKSLHPLIWNLPSDTRTEICEGHMAGDGGRVRSWRQAKTVSSAMAAQLRLLVESTGVKANLHRHVDETPRKIEGREIQSFRPVYTMRWYERDTGMEGRKPSGPIWETYNGVKYRLQYVKSVMEVPYEGDVWNLTVKGDPTFQTSVGMSHNTVKPVEIMEWCMRDTNPGDDVVEPFGGSGTTACAAPKKGVNLTLIELNEEGDYGPIIDARVRHWANNVHLIPGGVKITSEFAPEVEEEEAPMDFMSLVSATSTPRMELGNSEGEIEIILLEGNCVERMQEIPSNSVDWIITDPPYGLKFMSKKFDNLGEGAQQREWHFLWLVQAFRILKPGGEIKAFCGTRTQHHLLKAMSDAGFEGVDTQGVDSEAWMYGSGFPKSLDVSKEIDRQTLPDRQVQVLMGMLDGSIARGEFNWELEGYILVEKWTGWGTALKPAWEPVCCGRKPE